MSLQPLCINRILTVTARAACHSLLHDDASSRDAGTSRLINAEPEELFRAARGLLVHREPPPTL